jgi:hypothetical protein
LYQSGWVSAGGSDAAGTGAFAGGGSDCGVRLDGSAQIEEHQHQK